MQCVEVISMILNLLFELYSSLFSIIFTYYQYYESEYMLSMLWVIYTDHIIHWPSRAWEKVESDWIFLFYLSPASCPWWISAKDWIASCRRRRGEGMMAWYLPLPVVVHNSLSIFFSPTEYINYRVSQKNKTGFLLNSSGHREANYSWPFSDKKSCPYQNFVRSKEAEILNPAFTIPKFKMFIW